MAAIRVTMVMEYDVPDDHKDRVTQWGSADLVEMAKVDEATIIGDPAAFVEGIQETSGDVRQKITVEPVEP